MNPRSFYFPVVTLLEDGSPDSLLGNAFPVNPDGDLLTCRHVVDVKEGVPWGVLDPANGKILQAEQVDTSGDADLACLRGVLEKGCEFFTILPPGTLVVGHDVFSYGHYGTRVGQGDDGYFKGNVVSFRPEGGPMTLSYPIVEGLSGSPVTKAHNGTKVVGLAIGSEQQRIQAREIVDFAGETEIRETIHRIVEFGLALRVEDLISFCAEIGIPLKVSAEGGE